MDELTFQEIAGQLRMPTGETGRRTGEKMNTGNQLINEWTIELLNPRPNDNILEIGMGNGAFVEKILQGDVSISYSGIDYSDIMIKEATMLNKSLIEKNCAHFLLGRAEELPFMCHSFDKVFSVNTIYFWEDTTKVFNEIKKVLKPEGKLIIAIRPESVMSVYPFAAYGFRMFSKDALVGLFESIGFHVTDVVERDEPEQELNGNKIRTASLIVGGELPEV